MKNYYSILGVTVDCSEAEIKSAYRKLARKFHPDINPNGEKQFKDICEAYEVLSDAKKKLHYDTLNGFFKTNNSKNKSFEFQKNADLSRQTQQDKETVKTSTKKKEKYHKEYHKEFTKKFNDIFENISKNKKEKPLRGSDIYEDISITIKEALNGTVRIVNVMHTTECPHCKGRKFINGAMCSFCDGKGEKSDYKKISVKIPKNIKNGTKLRIANEGSKGENGGKNGDLYLKINIKPDSKMQVDGADIIYNVPITPFEAVLGGTISIPSFDANLTLKVPAKTHSGQKFRLAGQGFKQNGKSGDMIVIVHIEIPSSLSDDEIKLYEKLKKLSSQNIRENLLNE